MSKDVTLSSEGSGTSDGFEALANLNDGFLGTGYSSSVENPVPSDPRKSIYLICFVVLHFALESTQHNFNDSRISTIRL